MTGEDKIMIVFLLLGVFVFGAFVASLPWQGNQDINVTSTEEGADCKHQMLEDYRKRFEICFDYSDKVGDYVWRHEYCRDAEKEYLEVFDEIYNPEALHRRLLKEALQD